MPDILTHLMLGEDVHEYLHERGKEGQDLAQKAASVIAKRFDLFIFGTQGPDVFFYHNFWPWLRKKSLSKFGSRLHLEKTGDFFIQSLKYLKEIKGSLNDKPLESHHYSSDDCEAIFAYLCGCLCHFILDKNVHPYVYRLAGFDFEQGKEKGYHSFRHQKLEAIIDCILLQRKRNKDASLEPIHELLKLKEDFPINLGLFYSQVIQNVYGIDLNESALKQAFRDMTTGVRLIYDPHHVKKRLFTILGKIVGKEIRLPRPLYPVPLAIDQGTDYLNDKRLAWCHPLDEKEEYVSSFLDIFEQSVLEAVESIMNAADYVFKSFETLDSMFKNISYLTNKEWGTETAWRNAKGEGILTNLRIL